MKKIIFLGDSITDSGRLWLNEYHGMGNGYVRFLDERFHTQNDEYFEKPVVLNKGHDGFTLPFLLRTLDGDCLRHHPDGVSILIGINDVAVVENTGKSLADQEFGANYDILIRRLLKQGIRKLFLLGPFLFPWPQEYVNWMEQVQTVENIQATAARRYQLPYLPLQESMNQAAEKYGIASLTSDGIHLTEFGHQLLAKWWWEFFSASLMKN